MSCDTTLWSETGTAIDSSSATLNRISEYQLLLKNLNMSVCTPGGVVRVDLNYTYGSSNIVSVKSVTTSSMMTLFDTSETELLLASNSTDITMQGIGFTADDISKYEFHFQADSCDAIIAASPIIATNITCNTQSQTFSNGISSSSPYLCNVVLARVNLTDCVGYVSLDTDFSPLILKPHSYRYLYATAKTSTTTILPINVSVAAVLTFEDQSAEVAYPRSFSILDVTLKGNGFASDAQYDIRIKANTQDDCNVNLVTNSITIVSKMVLTFQFERDSSVNSLNCAGIMQLVVGYESATFEVNAGVFVRLDASDDIQSVGPIDTPGVITLSGSGFLSNSKNTYTLSINCNGISDTQIYDFTIGNSMQLIVNLTENGVDLSACAAGT